jgi:uncharacterized protein YegL
MSNFLDFTSDNINVFHIVVDESGSLQYDKNNVVHGVETYKKSFEDFPEKGSIIVGISKFADNYTQGDFQRVEDMKFEKYNPNGETALNDAIVKGANALKEYITEIMKKKNVIPIGTLVVFSDGGDNHSKASTSEAKAAIKSLNEAGINTVFVAFGRAISSSYGENMGFQATKDVDDREDVVKFMEELSCSCKEQSQSMKALGKNFFSKAVNSQSLGYSKTTSQALDNDDWFDLI